MHFCFKFNDKSKYILNEEEVNGRRADIKPAKGNKKKRDKKLSIKQYTEN